MSREVCEHYVPVELECDSCMERRMDIIGQNGNTGEHYEGVDPNGVDQHSPGAKLDLGKNRMGLVLGGFSRALAAVSYVGTTGAQKYSDNGWMSVPDGEKRYLDAMLRHLFDDMQGEEYDDESHLMHMAHMAWNALAVLEFRLRRKMDGVPKEDYDD